MTRRLSFLLLLAALCHLEARQPNVVFIFCDDLGWGDLGAYGNREIQTPHINRLAKEGTRFTQFYVAAPVCSPSRAGLVTGRFPGEVGIHYAIGGPAGTQYNSVPWLDADLPTIYDTFKRAGYVTGHYGKWHMGHSEDASVNVPPPSDYGITESGTTHSSGPGFVRTGEVMTNANKSELIGKRGVEFIERHADEPFFLSLWIMDPHSVLDPTQAQMDPYMEHTHPQVRDHYRSSMTVYYAIISNIDRAVGAVMESLEAHGLREDTLVIFSSDNGPSPLWSSGTGHAGAGSAGPLRGVKGSLYEGGIRVPFIASQPGRVPENSVDTQTVLAATDLFTTLSAYAGLPLPESDSVDGENLAAALEGEPQLRKKALYWDYRFGSWGRAIQKSPRLAMRDGDWKLMMNPDGSRVELYNLADDPMETADRSAFDSIQLEAMRAQLMRWYAEELMDPELASPWSGQIGWPWPRSGDL